MVVVEDPQRLDDVRDRDPAVAEQQQVLAVLVVGCRREIVGAQVDTRGRLGRGPKNLCNRGTTRAGVQLELSRAVRRTMLESLTRADRREPTARFELFVRAVRRVLG